MRISTKSRYAVNAMIIVALNQTKGPVSLALIGEQQNVSQSYLEQIFRELKKAELVDSIRGPGGGYTLSKAAEQITLADISNAVNAQPSSRNQTKNQLQSPTSNLADGVWDQLAKSLNEQMQLISLHDLIKSSGHAVQASGTNPVVNKGVYTRTISSHKKLIGPNSVFALSGY